MSRERRDCDCVRVRHDHGQYQMYHRHGCRCLPCGIAASQAKARYVTEGTYTTPGAGFVDRTGTTRRLQALLAIGWRHVDLSTRLTAILGRRAHSELILRHPGTLCFSDTARAVAAVYDELSMTPGPSQPNRNRARKLGYAPPLAWDEGEIDNPAATPRMPDAGRHELKPCGTASAYRRHVRHGEKPCSACVLAEQDRQGRSHGKKAAA